VADDRFVLLRGEGGLAREGDEGADRNPPLGSQIGDQRSRAQQRVRTLGPSRGTMSAVPLE
jgi:hypothetical protein